MALDRKQRICALLDSIQTGDTAAVAVVNEAKYIQHNPQTHEGSEGLAVLFKRLAKTSPRVKVVRIFEDGDFVFGHTEYDFASRNIGFEVFRFEADQAVEHWDNIQPRQGPNSSGHSMVDGAIAVEDSDQTEFNRAQIQSFVEDVLIAQDRQRLADFVDVGNYIEHHAQFSDDHNQFQSMLGQHRNSDNEPLRYVQLHRVLADGCFVLSMCEGVRGDKATSFFDLYRLAGGKIVEHWNTTEAIPPESEWKNTNGKF